METKENGSQKERRFGGGKGWKDDPSLQQLIFLLVFIPLIYTTIKIIFYLSCQERTEMPANKRFFQKYATNRTILKMHLIDERLICKIKRFEGKDYFYSHYRIMRNGENEKEEVSYVY